MITSIQNEKIKAWKKLKQRKYRKQSGTFMVEGYHLLEEAYQSNWMIDTILLEGNAILPSWVTNEPVEIIAEGVFRDMMETVTPQGIAAIVQIKTEQEKRHGNMLLIDAVQDPGNLGTMIRTADALGFSQVVLGEGCVDVFNEKVIRASQGSIFHLPIVNKKLDSYVKTLKDAGYVIFASTLEASIPIEQAIFTKRNALIVGNEGEGVQNTLLEMADENIQIPMMGKAESLNVSVAAGIMMYSVSKGK